MPEDVPVPGGVRVAERFPRPEYIRVPEGLRIPKNICVPERFRVVDRKQLKLPDPKSCSTRTPLIIIINTNIYSLIIDSILNLLVLIINIKE